MAHLGQRGDDCSCDVVAGWRMMDAVEAMHGGLQKLVTALDRQQRCRLRELSPLLVGQSHDDPFPVLRRRSSRARAKASATPGD
jgi:hypothetical protein